MLENIYIIDCLIYTFIIFAVGLNSIDFVHK